MATRLQNITEATYQTGKPTIDRDAGVIRGVKILGATSKNGRDYSEQAMRDAAQFYEGIGVNTNHPDRSTPNAARTVAEGIGWLENITVKPGDGVYGDFHVIKSHQMANPLFEVAERKPDRLGLSHNASGDVIERNSRRIVESIKGVRSVDLVQNPATVNGLFESEEPVPKQTIKQLFESLKADDPKHAKSRQFLAAILEMDGMAELPVEMAAHAEGATAEAEPVDATWAAFRAAIVDILDGDTSDVKAALDKIQKLLTAYEDNFGSGAGGTPTDTSTEDTAVAESLQEALAEIAKLKSINADKDATEAARTLLESSKVHATPVRISTLKRTTDKAERTALIDDWKKADGPAKPSVQRPGKSPPAPLFEQSEDTYKPAQTTEELMARLR